jgi:hypothetical protein
VPGREVVEEEEAGVVLGPGRDLLPEPPGAVADHSAREVECGRSHRDGPGEGAGLLEMLQRLGTSRLSGPHSGEVTARDYIESVYGLLDGLAELLFAFMKDRRQEKPLLPLLQEFERVAAYETGSQGWTGVDIVVLTRLQFAVVAFNAAFDESLYPSDARRPSRDRIITEMAAFFVHGTAHRPW